VFHLFRLPRRRVRYVPLAAGGQPRALCRRRLGWLRAAALAALLPLSAAVGNLLPDTSLPFAAAEPQMVQIAPANPGPQQLPLDEPLRMIAEARRVYAGVQDYQCILISQERLKGTMLPEQVMQMSFRQAPFGVYMKWLAPKDKAGQELAFVAGKNMNKMRVLPAGLGRPFGWQSIDVDDKRVKENSRHQITETGFGNMIERCAKGWEAERPLNKTQVKIAEYEYNKRRCTRVELTRVARDPIIPCYRTVVYFDKETHLPMRTELYDWPRQGGPPEGDLIECFSYIDIHFNVGLPDAMFNK